MSLTEFFEDLADLGRVDWEIMKAKMWIDTAADGDRRRRRQAEFLVHGTCPWTLIQEIGVLNTTIQRAVEGNLAPFEHRPPVVVRGGWYY